MPPAQGRNSVDDQSHGEPKARIGVAVLAGVLAFVTSFVFLRVDGYQTS